MPSLSPHASTVSAAMPASPHGGTSSNATNPRRPSAPKRGSSQSSNAANRRSGDAGTMSPGSGSEVTNQPLYNSNYTSHHHQYAGAGQQQSRQHHVKPVKHAKIVLPRNHSSGRNLAKLARQASQQSQTNLNSAAAAATATAAQDFASSSSTVRRSTHDADTDIRLPGSLDNSRPPPMRRNLTSTNLPPSRTASHTKLKKNLSHGHLTRLGSGKNLQAMLGTATSGSSGMGTAAARGAAGGPNPPSPGLKPRHKRPKSIDAALLASGRGGEEKDLHQQEIELAEEMRRRKKQGASAASAAGGSVTGTGGGAGPKKVGFAVGSFNDGSDDEDDALGMEGSGLQDDEWEDQSGSASPETTRQNTANNSRRTSVDMGKPSDHRKAVQLVGSSTGGGVGGGGGSKLADRSAVVVAQSDEDDSGAIDSSEGDEGDEDEDVEEDVDTADVKAEMPQSDRAIPVSEHHDAHEEDDDGEATPPAQASMHHEHAPAAQEQPSASIPSNLPSTTTEPEASNKSPVTSPQSQSSRTSSIISSRHVSNPTTNLLGRSSQVVAPALLSNVSAMDDTHSSLNSPSASLKSSRSNLVDGPADQDQDELVSRFIPSTSHPSNGSAGNSLGNNSSEHMPSRSIGSNIESSTLAGTTLGNSHSMGIAGRHSSSQHESMLSSQHRGNKSPSGLSRDKISPGSTLSGSSTTPTPAFGMSRTELRLKNEKFMADMQDAQTIHPPFPPHRYDRRNESLKSYLNLAANALQHSSRTRHSHQQSSSDIPYNSTANLSLGPEIFQGRFKAVNTELKVVQKFHDPVAASRARLLKCKDSAPSKRASSAKTSPMKGSVISAGNAGAATSAASATAAAAASAGAPASSAAGKALQTSKSALGISNSMVRGATSASANHNSNNPSSSINANNSLSGSDNAPQSNNATKLSTSASPPRSSSSKAPPLQTSRSAVRFSLGPSDAASSASDRRAGTASSGGSSRVTFSSQNTSDRRVGGAEQQQHQQQRHQQKPQQPQQVQPQQIQRQTAQQQMGQANGADFIARRLWDAVGA